MIFNIEGIKGKALFWEKECKSNRWEYIGNDVFIEVI